MEGARAVSSDQENDLAVLLQSVALGDRGAFRRVYDASLPVLFPICVRLMRDREAAQDILQEAMLRIWQKAHLFDRSKGNAIAWTAVLTRNCALSRLAVKTLSTSSLDEEAVLALVESKATSDPTAAADVRRCLKKLSEKYKKCISLIYLYGLSYEELATQMDAPLGSVKSWVHRAVRELGLCMEQ